MWPRLRARSRSFTEATPIVVIERAPVGFDPLRRGALGPVLEAPGCGSIVVAAGTRSRCPASGRSHGNWDSMHVLVAMELGGDCVASCAGILESRRRVEATAPLGLPPG